MPGVICPIICSVIGNIGADVRLRKLRENRLEIIVSTSYNKRYIRSGSYRSDHKEGRYMKKYVRGLLLFIACVSLLGGCSRSGKGKEEFAENTLYVAEDGSVSCTSWRPTAREITRQRSLRNL